jgi:cysteinyl-tRNA synthetase
MALKLYNTLSRKIEVFKQIKKGEVGMYTCGPTVYWYQHIGNLRAYIFADSLKRVLLYEGYKVKQIINITDVGHLTSDADEGEDKMDKAVKREGKSPQEIADYYFREFANDLKNVNFIEPYKWTKATEHVKEQIELIKKLEEKSYTYKTDSAIYFDVSKFKNYNQLSGQKLEEKETGVREDVVVDKSKKNPQDFVLWFFTVGHFKGHILRWESPWGTGFPGWHIECSAMSMKYLGEHFDIHTGGQDHIQVHHTNEIAQSEAATGKKFVNYWLHNAWLVNKDGAKISKSTGGLYTLSELAKLGYEPLSFRYFCLLTHYRKPLTFTLENLDAAKNAYERIKRKITELRKENKSGKDKSKEYETEFVKAIEDDLNLPGAIQVFLKALDDTEFDSKTKLKLLEKFDSVLGLGIAEIKEEKIEIPEEVKRLIEEREIARKQKNWAESDQLRKLISEKGFNVKDTPEGPKIEKI